MAYKDDFSRTSDMDDLSWSEIPTIQAPAWKNPFVSIQHGTNVSNVIRKPAKRYSPPFEKKKKLSYFALKKALADKRNSFEFSRRRKPAEQKAAQHQLQNFSSIFKKRVQGNEQEIPGTPFTHPNSTLSAHSQRLQSLRSRVREFLSGFTQTARNTQNRLAHIPQTNILLLVGGFLVLSAIVSAGAVTLGNIRKFPVSSSLVLPDEDSAQGALMSYISPDQPQNTAQNKEKLPPLPVTLSMRTYTVRSGDSIASLAKRFGLRADTIIAINNLQSQSSIKQGVSLRIPNMDGIIHKVRKGENLSSIAKAYGADMTKLVDVNELASATLNTGQSLFIPNARLASTTLKNFYGETFVWPVRGPISSPFGYRSNPFSGLRTYHSAIDIVVNKGTPVKATSEGVVADTGYNSVFGNYIIIRHDNGYQSLYAHLSEISVRQGSKVMQSSIIGRSGNTGQSTGPHLHFSIFKNGQALDPAKLVK